MEDYFVLKGNCLFITSEPSNQVDELAFFCASLLEVDSNELIIDVDQSVRVLHSLHIGVLILTSVQAAMKKKKVKILCTRSLCSWFKILGGNYLDFEIKGEQNEFGCDRFS